MLRALALIAFLLGHAACSPADSSGAGRDPRTLRLGVLPDQSPVTLKRRYGPLVKYLRAATDRDVQLVIPADYDGLVDMFDEGKLDLAWFGGLTFVRAEARCRAVPLVMRDVDLEFTSDFLVARSDPARRLQDLAGRSVAFGPRLSTSGHLMPRHFLVGAGLDPESFFAEVRHSTGHDETALWVQAGEVDLGCANSVVVESMFRDGRLDRERVRLLGRTRPFRNYVWAVPRDLARPLRILLLDAFLALDRTDPAHKEILKALGAGAFLPASNSHFEELRAAAQLLGGQAH